MAALVEYSDSESESESDNETSSKKRKLSIEDTSNSTLQPPAKKQKVSSLSVTAVTASVMISHDQSASNNEDSSECDSDDVTTNSKKRKIKRKIKGLSKASSLLSNESMTSHSVEFLQSTSKQTELDKMQSQIMNKHNAKQTQQRLKEQKLKESVKQSIAISEHEKKVRADIGKLTSERDREKMNPNRKTVKEKEKLRRMKGQSSQHSWKSETFMLLRQQFD